jgi:hypothetical protein
MTRVRTMVLGAALTAAGLGLVAPSARADGPSGRVMPGAGAPPMPGAQAEPERGPIRSFFHRLFKEGKSPRSGHSDWSTGRDDKLSKPWLNPPASH